MNNPVKRVSNKTRSTSKPNKQALKIAAYGKVEIFGVKNPDIKQVKDGDIITYEVEPNKQKTDWESKVMNDILKGFSCKGGKTLNGEDVYLMTKSDVDKLLKTQREEIISEIDRIEELKDEEVEIISSDPHKSIEPEIRNQLRKEIRERLKQIK